MAFIFYSPGLKFKERDLTLGRRGLKKITSLGADGSGSGVDGSTGGGSTPIEPKCGKQFTTGYMYNGIKLINCKTW